MKELSYKLQVPITRALKDEGERKAVEQGFGSLNNVVRLLVHKFTNSEINLAFTNELYPTEVLDPEYEAEVLNVIRENRRDAREGRTLAPQDYIKELRSQLNEANKKTNSVQKISSTVRKDSTDLSK